MREELTKTVNCDEKMIPEVAVARCSSYDREEVYTALRKAVDLLGGMESLLSGYEGRHLVMKPNLLAKVDAEKACTTHPEVFRAAGKLLQEAGFTDLSYGDSPGNPTVKVEKVAEGCGIKAAADDLGIPLGDFEHGVETSFPEGRVSDRFILCREIAECGGVINVCKMKTHQLERITGAVKNTFGCVFGVNKGMSHARFANAEVFARMIADLNALVGPALHIMDGITAMEGNGPQSGTPAEMNVIMVSKDPVAMDAVFARLVDLDPALVPTCTACADRGVGRFDEIRVVTEDGTISCGEAFRRFGRRDFDVERSREYRGMLKPLRHFMPLLDRKPAVNRKKCVGCGICVDACPVEGKAISVGRDMKASYDYSKCIKCYCCQEMCPKHAINVKKPVIARIAGMRWRF